VQEMTFEELKIVMISISNNDQLYGINQISLEMDNKSCETD